MCTRNGGMEAKDFYKRNGSLLEPIMMYSCEEASSMTSKTQSEYM